LPTMTDSNFFTRMLYANIILVKKSTFNFY